MINPSPRIPLLIPLAGLVCGIVASSRGPVPAWTGLPFMAVGIVILASCLSAARLRGLGKFMRRQVWKQTGVFLLLVGAGLTDGAMQLREDARQHPRFDSLCSSLPPKTRIHLRLDRKRTTQYGDTWQCRVVGMKMTADSLATSAPELNPDNLSVTGQTLNVRFAANPFVNGEVVSVPASKLASNRRILKDDWIKEGEERGLLALGRDVQQWLCVLIERSGLERGTCGFIRALIAGEQGMLDRDDRRVLSDAGLAHILAVSGMHVGILAGLLYLLFKPLTLARGWRGRHLMVIPVIWLFALASGFSPSVVRASVMLTVGICAICVQRLRGAGNALAAAAILILLFDPSSLFHIGFQLSFTCVAAILIFTEPLNPFNKERHPRLWKGMALMMVPVVASLSTWVLTAYYFGRVPLAFLPLNLIVVPLLPFYMTLAAAHLLISVAGLDATATGWLLDKGYTLLTEGASLISAGGTTVWEVEAGAGLVIAWLMIMAIAGVWLHSRRARRPRPAGRAS